ncbi:17435_t:CDS:2, partial [Gigaspora rosea]
IDEQSNNISIQNFKWEKDWTISAHSEASIEIKSLLYKKDLEKGTYAPCELNLWFIEQLITRQDNTMLTWQQIKRIRGLETKGKTPIWFKKLEETILEDQTSKEIIPRQSGKTFLNKKVHILECEENKENLVHDNLSSLSITPTSKILKMRKNEVEDVTSEKKTRGKKEFEVEHVTLEE